MKASFRALLKKYNVSEPEWFREALEYVDMHMENDGGHDWGHLYRVLDRAFFIASTLPEDIEEKILLSAILFHDIVNLPKNSPHRKEASRLSAAQAHGFFESYFSPEELRKLRNAIEAHSFSAKLTPESLEAKIVQDADRLESTGALAIARTFYTSGRMQGELFHPQDPFRTLESSGQKRDWNDQKYAVDHFYKKIFELPKTMHTEAARNIAQRRNQFITLFLEELKEELNP